MSGKNDSFKNHFKNTDNEKTQYIPRSGNSDDLSTAEFSVPNRGNRPYSSSANAQYVPENYGSSNDSAPNITEGRRRYYSSDAVPNSGQQPVQKRMAAQGYDDSYAPHQQANAPRNNMNGQQSAPPPLQRRQQNAAPRPANSGGTASPPQYQRQNAQQRPAPQQPRPQKQRPAPQPPKQEKAKKQKKKKKHGILFKLIITLLIIALIIFILYSALSLYMISKLNYEESGSRQHYSDSLSADYVTSVLIIGTDGRSLDEKGRSDTMILLSINSRTDEIMLTSFMRDSYVNIPGYGYNKLNAAYAYGGADLLMDTIEENFYVRIDDYIAVNFISFAAIVDSIGGIDMKVTADEAQEINTILMAEVNEIMGDAVDSDLLDAKDGKVHLSGKQALSYARIRHIGNADFQRTERQREVVSKVVDKVKSFNVSALMNLASTAVPQLTTNMSKGQLYLLSLRLPFVIGNDIKQLRIPAENTYSGADTDVGSVLQIDFDANYKLIRDSVFAD